MGIYSNENEKRQYISTDFDRCCQLVINTVSNTDRVSKDVLKFLNEVKNLDKVEHLGNYFSPGTSFSSLRGNKAFVDAVIRAVDNKKKYMENVFKMNNSEQIWNEMKESLHVDVLSVDYKLFFEMVDNQLLSGKEPDDTFFKADGYRPVILGYGYKDAFKIGDKFESQNGVFKCKVIGIFDKNSRWLNLNGNGLILGMENIDNMFVVLTNKPGTYLNTNYQTEVLMNNYLISKKAFDKSLKSKIGQIAEKYGFSVGIYSFNDFYKSERERVTEQSYLKIFSIIFLSVIAVFGLASLIIYGINRNKREIGIRIACGAGLEHIMSIFCIEILLITLLAFLTSCIMINSKGLMGLLRIMVNNLNIWVYIYTLIISIMTCIFSCVFPIRRIMKLTPRELTGGD
jgi:ABC-type antimicrobial peptide transport system permease subunit